MTEVEQTGYPDPQAMLALLGNHLTERKSQLLMLACVRGIDYLLSREQISDGINVLERFVDGHVSVNDLRTAYALASAALSDITADASEQRWYYVHRHAAEAASEACRLAFPKSVLSKVLSDAAEALDLAGVVAREQTRRAQAGWIRDIIGNPLDCVTVSPCWLAWNDGTIPRIAQAIYNDRAFDRMPILADALEDAGCDNADILRHCREPGKHVRGCWVVDLLLGKE